MFPTLNKKHDVNVINDFFIDLFQMSNIIETAKDYFEIKSLVLPFCRNPSMDLSEKIDAVAGLLAVEKNINLSDAKKIVLRFLEDKIIEEERITS